MSYKSITELKNTKVIAVFKQEDGSLQAYPVQFAAINAEGEPVFLDVDPNGSLGSPEKCSNFIGYHVEVEEQSIPTEFIKKYRVENELRS